MAALRQWHSTVHVQGDGVRAQRAVRYEYLETSGSTAHPNGDQQNAAEHARQT